MRVPFLWSCCFCRHCHCVWLLQSLRQLWWYVISGTSGVLSVVHDSNYNLINESCFQLKQNLRMVKNVQYKTLTGRQTGLQIAADNELPSVTRTREHGVVSWCVLCGLWHGSGSGNINWRITIYKLVRDSRDELLDLLLSSLWAQYTTNCNELPEYGQPLYSSPGGYCWQVDP